MNVFLWLEKLSGLIVYELLSIEQGSQLASSLDFFFNDIFKIFFLMVIITHFMGILRYFLPMEKIRKILVSNKLFSLDYFLAASFGALTPFCSCSSIPLFIGFIQARIPLGVTLAFLITSPLINEVAIALLWSVLGVKVTIIYLIAGLLIGIIGGRFLGSLNLEKYLQDFFQKISAAGEVETLKTKKISRKIFQEISKEAFEIIKKISGYIILGVTIGAFIHGFIPQGFFENLLDKAGFMGVPLAVILAVPFYSNASGVIPLIQALIIKGVPIGTALAFMMAVVGVSLPEALILKRVFKWQLMTIFFGTVIFGIIVIGYLINFSL